MNDEIFKMKQEAEHYSYWYNIGAITREEAKEHIQPYLDKVNAKSEELAKKYNQKPKKVTFRTFVR